MSQLTVTHPSSICCAILDEAGYWQDESGANPSIEVFNAIRASMATFGDDGFVMIASSPYRLNGLLGSNYKRYFGTDDPDNLVWQADTRTMNPSVPQSFIDAEYQRDPISAAAEYGASFRVDVNNYIELDVLNDCVDFGVHERLPEQQFIAQYVAFIDAAGGSGGDSFTCAIAHSDDDGAVVLDAIREWKPKFSPQNVIEEIAQLFKSYSIVRAISDKWGGDFPIESFAKHCITVEPSAKPKSDIYRELLPIINSQKSRLLDSPRLISQLANLERRTARGGKDSIDHCPGGHDDLANAVAGVIVQIGGNAPTYCDNNNVEELIFEMVQRRARYSY
jgi:hypothetical protein